MTDEQKKARLIAWFKVGLVLAAAALISPGIFFAVKGLLGLAVAVPLAAIIGLSIVNFASVLSMKFANWGLKARKQEARENPIETRQNIALLNSKRLQAKGEELVLFAAEVRNFSDEVKVLRSEQPDDAADFDQQLAALNAQLLRRQELLRRALAELEAFKKATERAARKWKVIQSALRMKKLSGDAEDAEIEKIMAAESLDAVQTGMNRIFAELDMEMAMNPATTTKAITNDPVQSIDMGMVIETQKVPR